MRIDGIEFLQKRIAMYFRHDRCGRNNCTQRVTVDNRFSAVLDTMAGRIASIKTASGFTATPSSARSIASLVAPAILSISISCTLALPIALAQASETISCARDSRRLILTFLLSFSPIKKSALQ